MVEIRDPDSLLEEPLELPSGGDRPKRPGFAGKRRPAWKLGFLLVGLVVLAAVGYGLWHVMKKSKQNAGNQPAQSATQTPPNTSSETEDVPDTNETQNYKSDLLSLQITYPTDWQVSEKDGLRVTSPDFNYQTSDKGTISGNFRMYVRRAARPVDGKYIGNGVVIRPSEQLAYADPGTNQRKTTNFTQFGSATSDHFTFFMVTGDFNLKKDDTLGPNYGREAGTYILAGGYGTKAQTDDLDFSNVPLEHFDSTRAYKKGAAIIKSLKLL